MKANNFIEINGKRYDARTGELISAVPKKVHHITRSVDGISAAPNKSDKILTPTAVLKEVKRREAAPHMKRRVHHSTTLHRRAVKAPVFEIETPKENEKATEVTPKFDSKRLERAQAVTRSQHISRFGVANAFNDEPEETTAPEVEQPASAEPKPEVTPDPEINLSQLKPSTVHKVASFAAEQSKKERPMHIQPHSRTKLYSYGASGLVVLLLAGYVAYLNVPSLSMKVAASRAGFAATMPGQTPSGYSLNGPVMSSPGQVTLKYSSNTDNRQFSVKQQPTTWDSTALLENYVAEKDKDYLTYQDRGLTVYIYDGGNAAWVNGGKMYTLDGSKTELDTRQILNLATSM
jgi:hypothetical protein